ncbi:MAG TPA: hypothetical protein PLE35_03925, partial [Lentisphaeria bacterium]|nr:hypothetical protein [Lentisphaeria bacterium]
QTDQTDQQSDPSDPSDPSANNGKSALRRFRRLSERICLCAAFTVAPPRREGPRQTGRPCIQM